MIGDILKLILIGALAACPPGPVAALVLQKTFCNGRKGGLAAGSGSGVVDVLYALIAILSSGIIIQFIEGHSAAIMTTGGVFVAIVGLSMARRKRDGGLEVNGSKGKLASFPFQAMLCALANPGAIAIMLALVSFMGISPSSSEAPLWLMLICVFCGEMLWWTLFTAISLKIKHKINDKTVGAVCKGAGIAVIVLGLVISVRGIINLI